MNGQQSIGLIPASTTLLQPASGYYSLFAAFRLVDQNNQVTMLQQSVTTLQGQVSTIQSQIASLQATDTSLQNQINTINGTLTSLQNQINVINTRLANAGIP